MPEFTPETYRVRIDGTRPLLMHRPSGIGQTKGRQVIFDPVEDAKKALYLDRNGAIVVPSLNLLSCLRTAGTEFTVPGRGKKTFKDYIYAGLRIEPLDIPLIYSGEYEIDQRPVKLSGRVMRARPKFYPWGLEFQITIVDSIIHHSSLKDILILAGRLKGLGDFRPLFGLFELSQFERVEE